MVVVVMTVIEVKVVVVLIIQAIITADIYWPFSVDKVVINGLLEFFHLDLEIALCGKGIYSLQFPCEESEAWRI